MRPLTQQLNVAKSFKLKFEKGHCNGWTDGNRASIDMLILCMQVKKFITSWH